MPNIKLLVDASELSSRLGGNVSAERLEALAKADLIPHYQMDGKFLFSTTEATKWIEGNLLLRVEGRSVENTAATIINVVAPNLDDVVLPLSLRGIHSLLIPVALESVETPAMPGIYFLCMSGDVVYVGQSVDITNRIGAHLGRKTFDAVFLLRVPAMDLNYVEDHFIQALRPKYNFNGKGDRLISPRVDYVSCDAWRLVRQHQAAGLAQTEGDSDESATTVR